MLRNTAAGTSSIALFISPQICKISLPRLFFGVRTLFIPLDTELSGHSLTLDVVLQTHCAHAPSLQRTFIF